jgi:hypothetical protein
MVKRLANSDTKEGIKAKRAVFGWEAPAVQLWSTAMDSDRRSVAVQFTPLFPPSLRDVSTVQQHALILGTGTYNTAFSQKVAGCNEARRTCIWCSQESYGIAE